MVHYYYRQQMKRRQWWQTTLIHKPVEANAMDPRPWPVFWITDFDNTVWYISPNVPNSQGCGITLKVDLLQHSLAVRFSPRTTGPPAEADAESDNLQWLDWFPNPWLAFSSLLFELEVSATDRQSVGVYLWGRGQSGGAQGGSGGWWCHCRTTAELLPPHRGSDVEPGGGERKTCL